MILNNWQGMQLRIMAQLSILSGKHSSVSLVLVVFALLAISLSIWQGLSYFSSREQKAELEQKALDGLLLNAQQRAADQLTNNAIALHIIAHSPTLKLFAKQPRIYSEDLKQLFRAMIEASPNVYKILYIDKFGNERIRINKLDNQLLEVEPEALQNKSHHRFFKDTIELKEGFIYVSEMNLNMENGQVQEPWIPTIRLATPVTDEDGSTKGIFVININVQSIFKIYNEVAQQRGQKVYLINPEGYWMYGQADGDLWGFMFDRPEDKSNTVQSDEKLWSSIKETMNNNQPSHFGPWTVKATHIANLFPQSLSYANPNTIVWQALLFDDTRSPAFYLLIYLPFVSLIFAIFAFSWAWIKNLFDQHRAEKELLKSEKLSSLGSLVAGVAHELNTPIGSAVTITSTLEQQAVDIQRCFQQGTINKSSLVGFVDNVAHGTQMSLRSLSRANDLIGNFKQVAVDQSGEQRRKFKLDEYIEEMSATFQHLFRHRQIDLKLDLKSQAVIDSYPGALSQIIINLVQNSLKHGFNEDDAGEIIIKTYEINNDEIQIDVIDNGKGIESKNINKIFDPFFTTKLGLGGSGLGLHIVYSFVKNLLQGHIQVNSDCLAKHTCFSIRMPKSSSNHDHDFNPYQVHNKDAA